jgi:hypothetical protein
VPGAFVAPDPDAESEVSCQDLRQSSNVHAVRHGSQQLWRRREWEDGPYGFRGRGAVARNLCSFYDVSEPRTGPYRHLTGFVV